MSGIQARLASCRVGFRYLLALLVALVLADGLITNFLTSSGLAREGNPLAGQLLANGWLMGFKAVGALVCALFLEDIHRRRPELAYVVTLVLIAACSAVIYWNIFSCIIGGSA